MAEFAYEARNDSGHLIAGRIAAETLEQAGLMLSQRNLFVVRIGVEAATSGRSHRWGGRVSRTDSAWMMSQLAVMVETGMLISEALDCLIRQSSKPRVREMLEAVATAIKEGRPLSAALEEHPQAFPPSVTALVRAGELNGTMSRVLTRCAAYQLSDLEAIKKVKVAVMYPAFMLCLCAAVTVFLVTVILPRFERVFSMRSAVLPLPTRMLLGLSHSLTVDWYLWLLGTAIPIVAWYICRHSAFGGVQCARAVVRLPILAPLFNSLYQSRSFRTLATLLDTGVPLVDALGIVKDAIPNACYKELWQEVSDRTTRGERMSAPLLECRFIPEPIALMIDCGDRSGKLGTVFGRLADHLEREYDQALKATTQFIEPGMIMIMGGIIGFIAASIMLPLFQASRVVAG